MFSNGWATAALLRHYSCSPPPTTAPLIVIGKRWESLQSLLNKILRAVLGAHPFENILDLPSVSTNQRPALPSAACRQPIRSLQHLTKLFAIE